MAISVVQRTLLGNAAATSTIAKAFSSNVTAGNKVIVIGQTSASQVTAMTGVTGSQGKLYNFVKQVVGSSIAFKVWIADSMNAAAETVTLTTGLNDSNLYIFEVSGLASVNCFDTSIFANQSSATALSSGATGTLSFANELIIAVTGNANTTGLAPTVGAGYSNLQTLTTAFMGGGTEEKVVAATTAVTGTFGLAANSTNETTAVFTFADTTVNPTIQFVEGQVKNATASPAAFPLLGSSIAVGDLIVVEAGGDGGQTGDVSGITDTFGNTYHQVPSFDFANGAGTLNMDAWYTVVTTAGAHNIVSVAFVAANENFNGVIQHFNGFIGTPTLDQAAKSSNTTSTTVTSTASGATAQATEIVVGMGIHASTTTTWTLGAGYTNLTTSEIAARGVAMESKLVTSTGAQTATFTLGATKVNMGALLTFYDAASGTSASVTQVAANVTATGGTQAVATTNFGAVTQSAANVTATGGTQVVSATVIASVSITQVAANITATGGTQAVATSNFVTITQVHGTITATGGTQSIATTSFVSVTQVAANVTATGGTQLSQQFVADAQVAANAVVTGGTQVVTSVQNVAITQVHATLTATGGTQVIATSNFVTLTQVAGVVTATGGTQVVASKQVVAITQVHGTLTATGGTQSVNAVQAAAIAQIAAVITATGGTQVAISLMGAFITQVAASILARTGVNSVNITVVFSPQLGIILGSPASTSTLNDSSTDDILGGQLDQADFSGSIDDENLSGGIVNATISGENDSA